MVGRRAVLSALGVAGAVSLAGCLGVGESEADTEATIDPTYGFVGASKDAEAPAKHDHEVQLLIGDPLEGSRIPTFYFDPTGLFVEAGDVVRFVLATPDHTVTAFHPALGRTQRVPDDVPAVSSPVLGGGTYWLYQFDTPGVYDLYCAPHEQFGMVCRVVVGEASGPAADPVGAPSEDPTAPRPPAGAAATVLNDPALAPEMIVEGGTVAWADVAAENKVYDPTAGH